MIIFKARQASDPQYLLEVIHDNFGNATLINFSLEIPFFSVERAVFDVDPEIFIKGCDYMAETDRFKELYSSPDIMLRSARFLDDNLDGELVPDFVVRMYLRGKIGYRLLYNNYIIHLKKEEKYCLI